MPISYFSSTKIPIGTILKVPLRKSYVPAIVMCSRDVRSAKSDIRKAGFLLKKIRSTDITEAVLPTAALEALTKTAEYYATSIGAILSIFLPKLFLEEINFFFSSQNKKYPPPEHSREVELLQMEIEERYSQYRALVRQAFARGRSVMFVVPTQWDSTRALKELSKGIEEFVYAFTVSNKKSEMKKLWRKAVEEEHPVLLITTPSSILFPRNDIDTLIIERENSRSYRTLNRPFIHLRYFMEKWAKTSQMHLVMGDSILSLETLIREKRGDFGESSLIRWRLPGAQPKLVNSAKGQDENGKFEIITPQLKSLITQALNEKEKIFLFGVRKGLAPTTICGECGTVLPCLNCGAPVVLHEINDATVYICHACRARRESATVCGYCGSWKLTPLGIGVEQIARAVREMFPRHNVQILDKDHAPTDTKARSIMKKFNENGEILVGTELTFFYLENIPYSGLISLDALFSIPDFAINERIFYLVNRLREITQKEIIIQTRNIGKQILAWASSGNIVDFYQDEVREREALLYPPFSIFIKVSTGRFAKIKLESIKSRFIKWQPDILKDSLIIRVPRGNWPDSEIVRELTLLPLEFSIKVDPESIL